MPECRGCGEVVVLTELDEHDCWLPPAVPARTTGPSWVLRIGHISRICFNCDDHIRPGTTYFLMITGETFCNECPPEEPEGCGL